MTRYWCMRFEGKHNYFKDLAHRIKQFKNIAMSLSHRHQQLVCYQLSKSQSLVKGMQTSKCILHIYLLMFNIYMHTGHQSKVNELEYGDLLVEACLVVNGETEIHRYS